MNMSVLLSSVFKVIGLALAVASALSGFYFSTTLGFITIGTSIFVIAVRSVYRNSISQQFQSQADDIMLRGNILKKEYTEILHEGNVETPENKLRLKGIEAELKALEQEALSLHEKAKALFK